MKRAAFNPDWLHRRLADLLPAYPAVNLCVALSGGLDSSVLLAALATHARRRLRKRTRLRAVHVHHGLHPNADQWSEHSAALARQLDVPLTTIRVKVARARGDSLEAAARDARYAALAEALEPGEVLLTAHHEDDQLETVFLQLMRGAGIAGLAAMPDVAPFAKGTLARPLLTRSRAELEAWARSNDVTWIDDDTNANEQLDRNYLRRRVLPVIRERWPAAARSVSRSARHAAEAKHLLDALAMADVERASNGPALSVQHLRALAPARRKNAIRYWIAGAGHALPDATRLDEITSTLLDARPDANPSVDWNTTRLQRHADLLTLALLLPRTGRATARNSAHAPAGAPEGEWVGDSDPVPLRASTGVAKRLASSSATSATVEGTAWNWRASPAAPAGAVHGVLSIAPDTHGPLDLDRLPDTLMIRTRIGGERLRPAPGGRTRTLKQLLQENRIPLAERAHLPLLFSNRTLIAVGDRWLDVSVQATAATRNRGRIRWERE